jgi:putative SOS response-associated peptidase YedK
MQHYFAAAQDVNQPFEEPRMCGRFTHMMSWAELVRLAKLATPEGLDPQLLHNFNVAPTQEVLIVRQGESGSEVTLASWGLVPSWAADPSVGSKMINARAETIATKPAFRQAFQKRRCLIPANGFFEWQKRTKGRGKKQPVYIRLKSEQPFAFAGLWERWDKGTEPLETCTIITCAANELISQFHDRMPVILKDEKCQKWLAADDPEELMSLLVPYPSEEMSTYAVSPRVNRAGTNDIECIQPAVESELSPALPTQTALDFGD